MTTQSSGSGYDPVHIFQLLYLLMINQCIWDGSSVGLNMGNQFSFHSIPFESSPSVKWKFEKSP